jgi:hypothetical protein
MKRTLQLKPLIKIALQNCYEIAEKQDFVFDNQPMTINEPGHSSRIWR